MFLHRHPYPPFIPENATKLIVGTINSSSAQFLPQDFLLAHCLGKMLIFAMEADMVCYGRY